MAGIVNLQTDLLRTFVSVVDLGGYTKAGEALGRSQPAISLQMRRLEDAVQAALISQQGRSLRLTAEGEVLLSYAREILRLNDEAAAYFRRSAIAGVLRVGLPTDYSVAFLQGALTEFARNHAEVSLEIRCDLSPRIIEQLHADELDLAIAMMQKGNLPYLSRSWIERPIWAAARDFAVDLSRPVPLAAHPEGCDYRARMIQALDAARLRWRIAYTGPGITGLQDAVLSGIGVTALTRRTLLAGMRILTEADGFPPLEEIRVGLFYKHPRLSSAGLKLVNFLVARLDDASVGGTRFERVHP
jgi:DNA-binding transcriptional LysR family regulator